MELLSTFVLKISLDYLKHILEMFRFDLITSFSPQETEIYLPYIDIFLEAQFFYIKIDVIDLLASRLALSPLFMDRF